MVLVAVALLIQLQDTLTHSTARPDLVHRNGRIPPSVTAIPAPAPARIDGRLDEPWWHTAVPATDFRRDVPADGNPASEGSEIRVAYDRNALYIGARLYHRDITAISRRLSRRDSFSVFNDVFFVMIDSYHDHRTAFVFGVTPAGEQRDMLTTSDGGNRDASWDPVWETKSLIDSLGWTAEMRIPFSQLRFPARAEQTWGIQFRRDIRAAGEAVDWSWTPRTESGQASKWGHLFGLRNIPAPRRLEVLPYSVSQARFIEGANRRSPFDDGSVRSLTGGLDLKYGLTSDLTLDATINPDFGQVEADPSVVNLTAFETFFEERRPFFVEGAGILDFGVRDQGVNFYYSRRIGRQPSLSATGAAEFVDQPTATSILGAGKLSGRTRSGWSIGAIGAITGRETARLANASGAPLADRPLEPLAGYGVFRLRRDFRSGGSGIGLLATTVGRDLGDSSFRALRSSAVVGGVDFFHRFGHNGFEIRGGIGGSLIRGDTAAINQTQLSSTRYFQRPDQAKVRYDPTRRSLAGLGGELNVGKIGGQWLYSFGTTFVSPGLELNDAGFQTQADRISFSGRVNRRWIKPSAYFRSFDLSWNTFQALNFEGINIRRNFEMSANGEFLGFGGFRLNLDRNPASFDDRATRGGPLIKRPSEWGVSGNVRTDGRRTVSGSIGMGYEWDEAGRWSARIGPDITIRSRGALSISFNPGYTRSHEAAFYVGQSPDPAAAATFGNRYLFAELDQNTLSLTTRVNLLLSPKLSVQLYAQPFVATGDYRGFQHLNAPRSFGFTRYGSGASTIGYNPADSTYTVDADGPGAALPIVVSEPDFRVRSLRSNLVVRWEYRPGSTIFLVWNQNRAFRATDPRFRALSDLSDIWNDNQQNVFLIKANYYFSL